MDDKHKVKVGEPSYPLVAAKRETSHCRPKPGDGCR